MGDLMPVVGALSGALAVQRLRAWESAIEVYCRCAGMKTLDQELLKAIQAEASRFIHEAPQEMRPSVTIRWADDAGEHVHVFALPQIVDRNRLVAFKEMS